MSLAVVIPVYNEEASIGKLIADLKQMLLAMDIDFKIFVINDGSTDQSLAILNKIAASDEKIKLMNELNSGHGPSLLKGYAAASGAEMVFQIDSDYQYKLEAFKSLWGNRKNYSLLVAEREEKRSSLARDIISFVSRLQTKLLFGGSLNDINSPFRLMDNRMLQQAIRVIPAGSFAPNMLISAYCLKNQLPVYRSICYLNNEIDLKKSRLSRPLFSGSIRTFSDMFRFRFNTGADDK